MADLENARIYVGGMYSPQATAWLALSDADATKTLVTATRYLDRLPWDGTATHLLDGQPTTLQWPRSGVIVNGVEIDPLTVPVEITEATYELAVLIAAKPGLVSQADQGSNLKRAGGGGAPEVEFFAPTSAARGTASTLPYVVLQLVGKFLASPSDDFDGGISGAGNTSSAFRRCRQLNLVGPE